MLEQEDVIHSVNMFIYYLLKIQTSYRSNSKSVYYNFNLKICKLRNECHFYDYFENISVIY